MEKLKLAAPLDDKPVKLTVELPAQVHRDLIAYADLLGRDASQAIEPAKLVAPMLTKFMMNDRTFQKALRSSRRRPDAALMNTATETNGKP
jgi:hypothetical protein